MTLKHIVKNNLDFNNMHMHIIIMVSNKYIQYKPSTLYLSRFLEHPGLYFCLLNVVSITIDRFLKVFR